MDELTNNEKKPNVDINPNTLRIINTDCYETKEIVRSSSSINDSLVISNFEDNSSNSSVHWLAENTSCLKIACANARSVVQKINSLITLFEECDLHIALLTETWLCLLYTSDAADE